MNFPLQHIEAYIDEAALIEGEQLIDEGRVLGLHEAERHFWLAQVQHDRTYEVEVKISPSKVRAVSCDCARFRETGQCGHIAAVLLLLRRELTIASPTPEPTPPPAPEPARRLTTGAVLEEVSHEDLLAFVKQYAKTNRNFALALKARFLPQVAGMDSREKYLLLLDSTIAAVRRPDRTFNQRGAAKIHKILLEIHHQIEEAVVQGYLAEAVVMAQSIIEKTTPLLRKLESRQEEIQLQIKRAFQVLQQILTKTPPPALREDIRAYCLRECRKLLYRNNRLTPYFYQVLMQAAQDPEHDQQLLDLLDEQLARYPLDNRELARMLFLKYTLLEKLDRRADLHGFVRTEAPGAEVLLLLLRQLWQKDRPEQAKTLALNALKATTDERQAAAIRELLLEIAEAEGDAAAVIAYAEAQLLYNLDFAGLANLKKAAGEGWVSYRPALLTKIKTLEATPAQARLLATIYQTEGLYAELLALLRTTRSIELVGDFGHLLLPHERAGVFALYKTLFEDYLHGHVGRKPSEKVRKIIRRLHQHGAKDMVEALVSHLLQSFPERHTLVEELAGFQTD